MRTTKLLIAVIAVFAVLAVPAMAQSPTSDAYGSPFDPGEPMAMESAPATVAASLPSTDRNKPSGAPLPFTGLEIAVILAAAGGLILLGVRLRRNDEDDVESI
jgi:hypothetical protein